MAVKIHFETLAPGMNAKLDATYRISNNRTHINNGTNALKKMSRNGSSAGVLADAVQLRNNR